jgi:hypothetical protein
MWMIHAVAISAVRFMCESMLWRQTIHMETPPRIAALLHGALCTAFIMKGQWDQAVEATGVFFVLDLLFNIGLEQKVGWDMMLHHVMGAILCLFSAGQNCS